MTDLNRLRRRLRVTAARYDNPVRAELPRARALTATAWQERDGGIAGPVLPEPVDPYPFSVDAAGVAFDAGTVGVRAWPDQPPSILGDGIAEVILGGRSLARIDVIAGGSGYASAPVVTIADSNMVGEPDAQAHAELVDGRVAAIVIDAPGAGYLQPPFISLSGGGGVGAAAVPVLGVGGTGYTSAPTVTISGGGGTGATAVAIVADGRVRSISLTNPGQGYVATPSITFSGGGGHGAAATALRQTMEAAPNVVPVPRVLPRGYTPSVSRGLDPRIAQVGIWSFGGDRGLRNVAWNDAWRPPVLAVTGGGGSGAVLRVTDIDGPPTGSGAITGVTIDDPGSGYTGDPDVVVSHALGSGAAIIAVSDGDQIYDAWVDDGGQGYTGYAKAFGPAIWRTATGRAGTFWCPALVDQQTWGWGGFDVFAPGWRNLRIRMRVDGYFASSGTFVVLRDGVIVWSETVSTTNTWIERDTGPLLAPTLGQCALWQAGPTTFDYAYSMTVVGSPRVDVPLPWRASGRAGAVVPGGLPANDVGVLHDPDLARWLDVNG